MGQAELEVACRARPDVKQSHSGRAEARAERRATTRERRSREPSSREPEQSQESESIFVSITAQAKRREPTVYLSKSVHVRKRSGWRRGRVARCSGGDRV